ncbi:hypothetical protein ABEF95_017299 [Exophiala dermatitidis]
MLRRNPTAITITSEDIASFEEAYLRRLAYAKYLKTGEDPDGLFRNEQQQQQEQQRPLADAAQRMGSSSRATSGAGGVVDPNDELKPLPGDQARIVRSREERIIGIGAAGGGCSR